MMQGKKEKPKVRLTRNADGSIGAPRDVSKNTEELVELWGKQSASLQLPKMSIKEEFSSLRKAIFNKKTVKKPNKEINKGNTKDQTNTTRPITITVGIPALRVPKKLVPRTKKSATIFVAAALVIVVCTGFIISSKNNATTNNGEVQGAVTSNIPTNVVPEFAVLTPLGKGVADLGGFAKISPQDKPAVYAYVDSIGDVKIKVSQQKLPDNLRTDQVAKLKELADGFNAKTPLEIGDNTAYIGASAKGAQSVIYVKGENLVLISSDNTVANSDWVTYIANLRF